MKFDFVNFSCLGRFKSRDIGRAVFGKPTYNFLVFKPKVIIGDKCNIDSTYQF